tara:strand:- start:1429 stop:2406 length:978 start_codon:yes stop_codon:yes gene_type:complete
MKNILKVLVFFTSLINLHALHGKIVFYDGTYVIGKVTKVDESSVYIIPVGLDTPEGVLVGNIDSLNMENGMIPVLNSNVEYFYQGGTFTPNNDDWMASASQQNYHEHIDIEKEFMNINDPKKHWNYFNFSLIGGIPLFGATSLKEVEPSARVGQLAKMGPNVGLNIQFPYYPVGPVDISPGLRLMTFSFEAQHLGSLKALQIGTFANINLSPILYFFPENLHLTIDFGANYNIETDLDQNPIFYSIDLPLGVTDLKDEVYMGPGIHFGSSVDYYLSKIPVAFKLFFNANVVPQTPPFTSTFTYFGNVGLSMVLILKRNTKNNSVR